MRQLIGQGEVSGPPTSGRSPGAVPPRHCCACAMKDRRPDCWVSPAAMRRSEFGTSHAACAQLISPSGEAEVAGGGFGFCGRARNQETKALPGSWAATQPLEAATALGAGPPWPQLLAPEERKFLLSHRVQSRPRLTSVPQALDF